MNTPTINFDLGHIVYEGTCIGGYDRDRMTTAVESLSKTYPHHNIKVWMNDRALPVEPLEWTVRVTGPTGGRTLLLSQRRSCGPVLTKTAT